MKLLLSLIVLLFSIVIGSAHAQQQPLDDVSAVITNTDGNIVTIQFTWNHDDTVSHYEVGCVSCIPNIKQTTIQDTITLSGVTLLEDGSVLLYILAYDEGNIHINVKQILLTLKV